MQRAPAPLRVSPDRLRLYGAALFVLGLLPLLLAPNAYGCHWCWSHLWEANWANFFAGGATAGSSDLVDVHRHGAWQIAHGFVPQPFVYPPAVALLYAPFAHIPLSLGFWLNALLMLAACVASGVLGARVYGMDRRFAILAVLAWLPATASIYEGTNASVAMLLALLCAYGLTQRRPVLAGIAVGLLLYKPSDALFFVVLLIVRREWRALLVTAIIGALWYIGGIFATGGNTVWPTEYAALLRWYYPVEFQHYGKFGIGFVGVLLRLGIPQLVAWTLAAIIGIAGILALLRASTLEAASMAGALALVTSAHALPYEAALLMPAIFYGMTHLPEPLRTRLIAITYAIGALSTLRWRIDFDPVALLVIAIPVLWIALRLRIVRPPARAYG